MEPSRAIVHFDQDAFFASVEQKNNSSLVGKPVIVGGGERGVVASCSYEARRFGVRSGMAMFMAKQLCPHAIIIKGDYDEYDKYSKLVTKIIASKVPVYEKASIDEYYLDLTGMDRFFGISKYTAELRNYIIQESGLPISSALASNKLLSKVATNQVKPNGITSVQRGQEKAYLAPLPVKKMPGIGPVRAEILRDREVHTIRVLSEIPPPMMAKLFGKDGIDLSRKANGIDASPVVPYVEQKSLSTEQTFSNDTINIQFLESQLVRMTEKIAFELRQQNKKAGTVTVKIKYSDFNTATKSATIPYTSLDAILLQTAKDLFSKLYDRRLLVRLLGIGYSNLVSGNHQIDIFSDTQEHVQLYQALDGIKKRYGAHAIMRARSL